jgi:hypothetical protein
MYYCRTSHRQLKDTFDHNNGRLSQKMQKIRLTRDSNPEPSDPKSDALSIALASLITENLAYFY